jgi:hypothetical protein
MDFGSIHAKKALGLKATLKIAFKISEVGQNLKFNFVEFIIIFLEILRLDNISMLLLSQKLFQNVICFVEP